MDAKLWWECQGHVHSSDFGHQEGAYEARLQLVGLVGGETEVAGGQEHVLSFTVISFPPSGVGLALLGVLRLLHLGTDTVPDGLVMSQHLICGRYRLLISPQM